MKLSSLTDIGIKRKENQDNFWSARLDVNGSEAGVICLCDGMGGLDEGELASRLVVEAVRDFFKDSLDFSKLDKVIKDVNKTLYDRGIANGSRLGTTCTVILCYQGIYKILHIGDSRCYHKSGGSVRQVTEDHSVIETYRRQGKILPPNLVKKYTNTLARCIGRVKDMHLDYIEGTYSDGDVFLVCSDGFWHFLNKNSFFNGDLENLNELILSYIREGETDNISVGVLEC